MQMLVQGLRLRQGFKQRGQKAQPMSRESAGNTYSLGLFFWNKHSKLEDPCKIMSYKRPPLKPKTLTLNTVTLKPRNEGFPKLARGGFMA